MGYVFIKSLMLGYALPQTINSKLYSLLSFIFRVANFTCYNPQCVVLGEHPFWSPTDPKLLWYVQATAFHLQRGSNPPFIFCSGGSGHTIESD